jgi:hypothetical protein
MREKNEISRFFSASLRLCVSVVNGFEEFP